MTDFFSHLKLSIDDLISDGRIHRFHINGDKAASKNGWYVVYSKEPLVGMYGSWKTGEKYVWNSRHQNSEPDGPALREKIDKLKRLRRFETDQRNHAARDVAHDLWDRSQDLFGFHPYLRNKKVKAFGLKTRGGRLLVPLNDCNGELHSLQFIDADGSKRFLPGGRIGGFFHLIGEPKDVLCVAEGYATAATIYEVTGIPTAVAFTCNNLSPVAENLCLRFADAKIVVCADNDVHTKGNPGLAKAREAAQKVGGFVAIPPINGDFNDFFRKPPC